MPNIKKVFGGRLRFIRKPEIFNQMPNCLAVYRAQFKHCFAGMAQSSFHCSLCLPLLSGQHWSVSAMYTANTAVNTDSTKTRRLLPLR